MNLNISETSSSINETINERLRQLEELMSPYASRTSSSRGREHPEPPAPLHTPFQIDRDRIIHTKAFRRLKHKTQVFIAPTGDHYVTRLTHTLEVAQVGRTIARALNLNEDLVEAMAMGHDLGHTPFGHVGEETLNKLSEFGFAHSAQSLRIVETLENDGRGLNLTWEVRQGIVSHSKPQGDFMASEDTKSLTLEAQICRIADAVAYLNHDIADASRAGILDVDDLPQEVIRGLGSDHAQRINTMITDIVQASWTVSGTREHAGDQPVRICMSPNVRQIMNLLREFMFQTVYRPASHGQEAGVARNIVRLLFNHFLNDPTQLPSPYFCHGESAQTATIDYLAGMTDHYAIRLAEQLHPGISREVFARVPLV
jgi:dGTPase